MKLECDRSKLESAIQKAARLANKHLTLPVLSCVYLEAADNRLIIKSTNLDIGIEIEIKAKTIEKYLGKEYKVVASVGHIRDLPKSNKKAKAYSYVSMVDGKIETHETWGECEARVKGTSGARFKKSVSAEDEADIIASFKRLG